MTQQKKTKKSGGGLVRTVLFAPIGLAAGWIAYSRFGLDKRLPLPDAISAERQVFLSQASGWLSYYVDKQASGRPLVLIHSVNAAASAYEMLPLFQRYRAQRPVYALDLPGYGFSNRLPRPYSPQLFQDVVVEFLETQVGEPVDAIALSLGAEFTARAALARPDLFHSLVLISPSGLKGSGGASRSQRAGDSGASNALYPLLSFPLWGRALFDLIATRRSLDYYVKGSFVGKPFAGLTDYGYYTAHQPGAENVPLYFLSGQLFTRAVAEQVYEQVQTPTLVIYDRDQFVRFDGLPAVLEHNPAWRAVRIAPTLGLPHFEKPDETTAAIDAFWQTL